MKFPAKTRRVSEGAAFGQQVSGGVMGMTLIWGILYLSQPMFLLLYRTLKWFNYQRGPSVETHRNFSE
ncbi:MAG: hypothetical protein WBO46_24820 [Caldilineaceae bacterium]